MLESLYSSTAITYPFSAILDNMPSLAFIFCFFQAEPCTYTRQGYLISKSFAFLESGVIICRCKVTPSIFAYSTFE